MRRPIRRLVPVLAAVVLLTGCGQDEQKPAAATTPDVATTSPTPSPTTTSPPCDPGGGFPKAREGCPDPSPETGWLSTKRDGGLVLKRFRTLGNDAAGEAYAHDHGLEYPFSNDYFDAPTGTRQAIELGPDTVCTGIIVVGYREPLEDHVVDCAEVVDAAASDRSLPVAVWRNGANVVQVSELYRP